MKSDYHVVVKPVAWKQIMALGERLQNRIFDIIAALENEPRPAGVEKMKGEENSYRVRVGDYRVVYEIRDDVLVIVVVKVGHQREIYRKPR